MKKSNLTFLTLNSPKGLGATDILVGIVVASIIAIIVYNIFVKVKSNQSLSFTDAYMTDNASLAINSITDDLMSSAIYVYGCKKQGLVKPKYGGLTKSDEIFILTGEPGNSEFLVNDMQSVNSELAFRMGQSFRIKQKLAICDEDNIDWFVVEDLSHKEQKGFSFILPEISKGNPPFSKAYKIGSFVGAFNTVEYYIGKAQDGSPALIRKMIEDNTEKVISTDIENLKFEYFSDGSKIAVPDPLSFKGIDRIRINVTARSREPVSAKFSSSNPLTGVNDGHARFKLTTEIPFDSIDFEKIKGLAFRIITDNNTGREMPMIIAAEAK